MDDRAPYRYLDPDQRDSDSPGGQEGDDYLPPKILPLAPPQQMRQIPQMPPQRPQGQMMAQQQPPPEPEPLSQADNLRIQQLQQYLSGADKAAYIGEINSAGHAEYRQQIKAQLDPLLARQQAQQQKAQQAAIKQAMQAAALQEGVTNVHLKARAQQFQDTVATWVDKATGIAESFYPDGKSWKPIKNEAHMDRERLALEQSQAIGGEGGGTGAGGSGDQPMESGSQAPGQIAAATPEESAQTGQPMSMDSFAQHLKGGVDPNTFEQTIISGPNVRKYVGGKQVSGPAEGPAPAPTDRPPLEEFARRAQAMIPRPQITGNHVQDGENMRNYMQEVTGLVKSQSDQWHKHREHQDLQSFRNNQNAIKLAQVAMENQAKHETARTGKVENAIQRADKGIEAIKEASRKQLHEINKHNNDETNTTKLAVPPHLASEDAMETHARGTYWSRNLPLLKSLGLKHEDVGLQTPGTAPPVNPAPKTGGTGLTPEQEGKPSSVKPEQVEGFRQTLAQAAIGLSKANVSDAAKKDPNSPEYKLANGIATLRELIQPAIEGQRPLTVGERKKYEDTHAELASLLKTHGQHEVANQLGIPKPDAVKAKTAFDRIANLPEVKAFKGSMPAPGQGWQEKAHAKMVAEQGHLSPEMLGTIQGGIRASKKPVHTLTDFEKKQIERAIEYAGE